MLLSLLSLAFAADPLLTGARLGAVPVTAISDEVFWSHVTLTPILQGPDGLGLASADFDVLAGTLQLHLTAAPLHGAVIDWSASYLQVAGAAVPVTFTPQLPTPALQVRQDTYGYTFAAPARRHATPRHTAIPSGGHLRGTLTRLDGQALIARPQPDEAPPAVVLSLRDGSTATILAGVAIDSALIPAHCADLKQRQGEGWLNLLGSAVLTGGLSFTSLRIYAQERELLDTAVPTLPTASLLALTGSAAATTGIMGARVGRAYRDHAAQCLP